MAKQYINPIHEGADPFILLFEDKYYLYPTLDPHGIRVFSSDNLVDWKDEGYALKDVDCYGDRGFWAPEILYRDGVFYMVFVANEHLGIATSKSPLGPFVQKEKKPLDEVQMIDGHFLEGYDGKTYLYFVRFNNNNEIHVAELNDDLLSIKKETEKKVLEATDPWETIWKTNPVCEGPFVLKHNNLYYLTYSCNHTMCKEYAVGCAVSSSPYGPFKKCSNNPILSSSSTVVGTGHHSFTTSKDGRNLIIVYHCHESIEKMGQRMTCIDKARFIKGEEEDLLEILGPTDTPQDSII